MYIEETVLDERIADLLIRFSEDWEKEASCWGYRKNTWDDLKDERIFLAWDEGEVVGYLLGHAERAEKKNSLYPAGTCIFEVSELYVVPSERSKGIGRELMKAAEKAASSEAEIMMLSTATRNARAILHFYLDEVGMEFYSARLFKRLSPAPDNG